MSVLDAAAAAQAVFPQSVRETLLAIAGAESGWSLTAQGDPVSALPQVLCGVDVSSASCHGHTSFGPWQVNLPCNGSTVARLSGIPASDPCAQVAWLTASYTNSARAALAIYQSQGLDAWTTYRTGAYEAYLSQAAQALSDLTATPAPPRPTPISVGFLVAGSVLVVVGGFSAAVAVDPKLRREAITNLRRVIRHVV